MPLFTGSMEHKPVGFLSQEISFTWDLITTA